MKHQAVQGFSLVEVLVSIVVLAVGVLGAAGMQLTALRTAQQSGLQSEALQLAAELADRMRANDQQMRLSDQQNPYLGVDYQAASGPPAGPAANCFVESCDTSELATFDLHQWQQRVHASLPGGRAVVCRDSEIWDKTSKRLSWECEMNAAGSSAAVIKIGWQGKEPDGKSTAEINGGSSPMIALVVSPYPP